MRRGGQRLANVLFSDLFVVDCNVTLCRLLHLCSALFLAMTCFGGLLTEVKGC